MAEQIEQENLDYVPIDTLTPSNTAHSYDISKNEFLYQHGLIASRITFKRVESCTKEYLLEHLKDSTDDLIMVNDRNDRWLIYKDQVLRYVGAEVKEIPIKTVKDIVGANASVNVVLDCPFPVVRYLKESNRIELVCDVPEAFAPYSFRGGDGYDFETGIWMPRMLFKIKYDAIASLSEPSWYVVCIGNDDGLYAWPGGNVHGDYMVCKGTFVYDKTLATPGARMLEAVDTFRRMGHNHDLEVDAVDKKELRRLYKAVVDELPEQTKCIVDELESDRCKNTRHQETLMKLAIMKKRGGWQQLSKKLALKRGDF
jgi:hypothetical protein